MAGIGRDLVVNLAGNNAKLKSTIAESKGGLKGFASAATSFLNPITAGFAAAAAGAASAGVAVYMFAGKISELAGIADEAVKTGLSGAFLQRLGYAADQSGVSVETLTGGIKKLTIAIGKGDAKPFESLGINFRELQGMSPEQQFKTIAEAISKLPTAADRAAAAVKIFGKSGIEMTGLFAGGMNDLNALLADAAALGIGVSDEGLARAAAADDSIQRMKASFGALIDQVTVGVAPIFDTVATSITNWIPPITEFIGKFNGLENKAQFMGDLFEAGLQVAFAAISEGWNATLDEMISATGGAAKTIASKLNPAKLTPGYWIGKGITSAMSGPEAAPGQSKLDAARANFGSVMSRLNTGPSTIAPLNTPTPTASPVPVKDDGSKVKALFGGLAESATGIFNQVKTAVDTKITEVGIGLNWAAKSVDNMFTEKTDEKPQSETKFASAMQKGSSDAFQTILRSMTGAKDPVVKATEKQTKELVKHLKPHPAPQFAPEFT